MSARWITISKSAFPFTLYKWYMCMFLGRKLWDPRLEEHMEMHAQLVPQDQISGFIWHETYFKHLDSQASKGAQVCANRLGFKF